MSKTPQDEIYLEVAYKNDPYKPAIAVYGDASGSITFETDATQLASVLMSLARFKDHRIGMTLKRLTGGLQGGKKKARQIKVYR